MSKFIERLKARHTTSGKEQGYEDVCNPHNAPLDKTDDSKEVDNTLGQRKTDIRGIKVPYKN